MRHWQHQLGLLTGSTIQPDWTPPAFDRWRLVERTHLNPGSPGGEAWLMAFEPVDHTPAWVAGAEPGRDMSSRIIHRPRMALFVKPATALLGPTLGLLAARP